MDNKILTEDGLEEDEVDEVRRYTDYRGLTPSQNQGERGIEPYPVDTRIDDKHAAELYKKAKWFRSKEGPATETNPEHRRTDAKNLAHLKQSRDFISHLKSKGEVDEGFFDKFTKRKSPGSMGRYMQGYNKPTAKQQLPTQPVAKPTVQPPVIKNQPGKSTGFLGNYMKGYNKPIQQLAPVPKPPTAIPPVIPKPVAAPPVIPPPVIPKQVPTPMAVPPVIPKTSTKSYTSPVPPMIGKQQQSTKLPAFQPTKPEPPDESPFNYAPQIKTTDPRLRILPHQTLKMAPQKPPADPSLKMMSQVQTPSISQPEPVQSKPVKGKKTTNLPIRGKVGTYKLEETITKDQLKSIIKEVAKVLKES